MRLIRIDHASLNSGDRAATVQWYDEVLGLRRAHPDAPDVPGEPQFLGDDGAQVALFADRAPGLRHVALATDAAGFAEVRAALEARGCERRGDESARALVPSMTPACEDDWRTEYLLPILSVKVVRDEAEAIQHIRTYGSGHTEAIVTEDRAAARRFTAEVDAAAVMVNASTRFTDGGEFGFGAEIGISTQKLHARGPMALPELTTTKWVVEGDGQVRV